MLPYRKAYCNCTPHWQATFPLPRPRPLHLGGAWEAELKGHIVLLVYRYLTDERYGHRVCAAGAVDIRSPALATALSTKNLQRWTHATLAKE
eukprot:scaffold218_cov333-Prasinococcus_capsulatus_cf.AAC.5